MHVLCKCDDISDGKARGFQVGELSLLVVRQGERYFAYRNHCPHLGLPLEWQADQFIDETSDLIKCFTHGALFVVETGQCVSGPCQGDRLQGLELTIENNQLLVDINECSTPKPGQIQCS